MNEQELKNLLDSITPLYADVVELAKARQDALAKPPKSLGELEEISIKYAGITGNVINHIQSSRIIVMCSDNGVCDEGVSSAPISVTMAQAVNMTKRKTGMSSLAAHFNIDVDVVDLGIKTPYVCDEIVNRHIVDGTKNFLKEPAMSREEAMRAIEVGIERARLASEEGFSIIGLGEMGIGNTTTSSAVLSVLTGLNVEEVTGRGGGLTDEAFAKKKKVIEDAIKLHKPNPDDVIDVLAKVGGFDIAAMCGAYLGAAIYRIPVVIDGFISVVAALCAVRLAPLCKDFMFASHMSFEPGYMKALDELGLRSYLNLGMRLGEGSGCPIAFKVIESALAVMEGMALFGEEAAIDDGYLDEIREGDKFSV